MVASVLNRDAPPEDVGRQVEAARAAKPPWPAASVAVASTEEHAVISEPRSVDERPAASMQIQNKKDATRYSAVVGDGSEQSVESQTRPTAASADPFAKIPEHLPAESRRASAQASLTPDLQIPDAPVEATDPASSARTAVNAGRTWVVQLSAQRTEEDAQAAFRAAQAKYGVLKGYQVLVRKKDQGGRGVFYAAQVGPLARDEANGLCNRIKNAGGSCLIEARPD
jgi:hypothetical protein